MRKILSTWIGWIPATRYCNVYLTNFLLVVLLVHAINNMHWSKINIFSLICCKLTVVTRSIYGVFPSGFSVLVNPFWRANIPLDAWGGQGRLGSLNKWAEGKFLWDTNLLEGETTTGICRLCLKEKHSFLHWAQQKVHSHLSLHKSPKVADGTESQVQHGKA